jgi:hypothetical protein
MDTASDPLLDELLADAKLVAVYGQRAGCLKDDALFSAIAAAEALPAKSWAAREVIDLQVALNAATQAILPTTLVDLKSGWSPFTGRRWLPSRTVSFVLLSILLMVLAGYTTFIHNQGAALLGALQALQSEQPERKFGQLERQLLNAQTQIFAADKPDETSLSREAYFEMLDDLRDIDKRLSLYVPQAAEYRLKAGWPVDAVRNALTFGKAAPANAQGVAGSASSQAVGPNVCDGQQIAAQAKQYDESEFGRTPLGQMFGRNIKASIDLSCYQGITFQPATVPSISSALSGVQEIVGLYALWILPCVYGALGAAIYYMRSILNPLMPDPSFARMIHRVALGAFAGIILAWFWTPVADTGGDLANIGFSLFGAAFLVGFSIDVFFALLDRLVSVTVGAIGRMGSTPASS